MFADLQAAHALKAPPLLGTCTPEEVAAAVLRAIERDEPELIVAHRPLRLMFAIGTLLPRLMELVGLRTGVHDMFLQAVLSAEAKAQLPAATSGEEGAPRR
jgi:hypothetical protein